MNEKTLIEDFLAQKKLAIVGASNNRQKYGNIVFRDLSKKGYQLYPVNPRAEEVEGERAYPDLASLPEAVGGIVLIVPPAVTEQVVHEAAELGIPRVWMQPGASSPEAIQFCQENDLDIVHHQCVMVQSRR